MKYLASGVVLCNCISVDSKSEHFHVQGACTSFVCVFGMPLQIWSSLVSASRAAVFHAAEVFGFPDMEGIKTLQCHDVFCSCRDGTIGLQEGAKITLALRLYTNLFCPVAKDWHRELSEPIGL